MAEGQASVTGPVTDTGTGAYSGPSEPTVYGEDLPSNPFTDTGTGAVQGPTEPTTYQSEDHEGPPTGAHAGNEGPVTVHAWPHGHAAVVSEPPELEKQPAKKARAKKK